MKYLVAVAFLCGTLAAGDQASQPRTPDLNVNSRYTVESISVPHEYEESISEGLRADLRKLIGQHLNPSALEELAQRIRRELHARAVVHRVSRGTAPDLLKVVFEVTPRVGRFDLEIPKALYHSKQGWSAGVEGRLHVADNTFAFGGTSDGDELAERYAGLFGRYESSKFADDRVRLRFQWESYHQQWNRATLSALDQLPRVPRIYRTRQNFEPGVTVALARQLTLYTGASFTSLETQFPAARTEAANAVITTLRYHRRLEDSDPHKQDLDAGYSLRAATRILGSNLIYGRHRAHLRYSLSTGHHTVLDQLIVGLISGRAPLFERYVLGNSSTLRGWNKFDLDPLGGSRMVHNSLEYRYRILQIFYDSGSIWDSGHESRIRHSAGIGLRVWGFTLAFAFPLREGRAEPSFILGMND